MANNRTATLAALAQQALDQYRTDIASGEPVFPQWALDLQQVLEEHKEMLAALQGEHKALDWMMARLIQVDPKFMPTKCAHWPAVVAGKEAMDKAIRGTA